MSLNNVLYEPIYRLTLYYKGVSKFQFTSIDFDANITRNAFESEDFEPEMYEITLYNLTEGNRGILQGVIMNTSIVDTTDDSTEVTTSYQFKLEATYKYSNSPYSTVLYDDVIGEWNRYVTDTWESVLKLRSGGDSMIKNFTAHSVASGTTAFVLITDLAQKMIDNHSIATYFINPDFNDKTYTRGYQFTGNLYENIKKICEQTSNTCYIENRNLYIAPAAQVSSSQSTIYSLAYGKGLLTYPQIGEESYDRKYTKKYNTLSYEFDIVFLPSLRLNDIINIDGTLYTVKRIEYELNTRNAKAISKISGLRNYK